MKLAASLLAFCLVLAAAAWAQQEQAFTNRATELKDRASADAKSPVRMAVLYMANGVNVKEWVPEGEGREFRLSPTLQPLAEFRERWEAVAP